MNTLNEKTLSDVKFKLDEVNYQWDDNFRLDLERFLGNLLAKQPAIGIEESDSLGSSYGSVFYKPKSPSGYGLNQQQNTVDKPASGDDLTSTPRLRG